MNPKKKEKKKQWRIKRAETNKLVRTQEVTCIYIRNDKAKIIIEKKQKKYKKKQKNIKKYA